MLQEALEEQALTFQNREDELRKDYLTKMHELVTDSARSNQHRLEQVVNRWKDRYQKKVDQMENQRRQLVEVATSKPTDLIIDLTDEDLEKSMELETEVQLLKQESDQWKSKFIEERHKTKNLDQIIEKANIEFSKLEDEFFELIKKNKDLELELENVRQEMVDLEQRYSERAVDHQEQVDYVEELEEQLNATFSELANADQ